MKSQRALYVLLLMVVGGIAACERADQLSNLTAPSASVVMAPRRDVVFVEASKVTVLKSRGPLRSTSWQCTNAVSGNEARTMVFDGGQLSIPAGAVNGPTVFCARNNTTDGTVSYEFRASSPSNLYWCLNSGTAESGCTKNFLTPLRLTLDLTNTDVANWSTVAVFYKAGTGFEQMPSAPNRYAVSVSATLTHFSDYVAGEPEPKDPTPILD